MTGRISGFKAEVTKVSPDVRFVHCIIHREHLTFRKIGCELNLIMNDVVSIVNIVKTRALNTRLFKILCEDMGSNHNTLLFHTDVRWLSRGKVLKRVIELSDELCIFLREIKPDLSALLSNEKWMCLASYLADVFDKVNELNVSPQGQSTNILVLTSKLQAFNKKLSSWLNAFNNGDTSMFTSLHDFLTVNELSLTTSVASVITEHMSSMLQFLYKYFPNLNINNEYNWIKTPFSTSLKYDHIPWAIKEQLIEIREDSTLESEFHEKELSKFWLRRQQEYPLISKAALLILIPFASTYLYKSNLETKPGLLVINSYLNQINPDLKDVQSEIKEVVGKQKSLINAMLKENEELSNLLNESEVQNMFSSIKHCYGQLVELKKKLMFLHKKTMTLEKRANVLRVAKQREALQREHQKESMLVREQELISKQS
ncbi:hypothetical protein QTP88_011547 [Uroleucon formosanum]